VAVDRSGTQVQPAVDVVVQHGRGAPLVGSGARLTVLWTTVVTPNELWEGTAGLEHQLTVSPASTRSSVPRDGAGLRGEGGRDGPADPATASRDHRVAVGEATAHDTVA
jgi:hypothetical protein